MYQPLGTVTLKTGERIEAGVVLAPDEEWAERICEVLCHKWDPWDWQTRACALGDLPIQTRFYILHRAGRPLCNIMTVERDGVGILGHVFTRPEERRKHATSRLMALQMDDFRRRGGRALYLGTGFDTPPYHIYAGHGFRGVEPGSGIMAWFAGAQADFERDYFGAAGDPVAIEPVDWPHWPASAPLFAAELAGGGAIKMAGPGLVGRSLTEEPVLKMVRRNERQREAAPEEPAQAWTLRNERTGAVLGLASIGPDPLWRGVTLLDVYCHPDHWSRAHDLADRLPTHANDRVVAYADDGCGAKLRFLGSRRFVAVATIPRHVPADAARTRWIDAILFARQ